MAKVVKETRPKDYFVFPNPILVVTILFGLWLLGMATFAPDKMPWFLGPLGDFAKYLGNSHNQVCLGLCVGTVIIHCFEAAYAEKLCIDKHLTTSSSVKWVLQTLVFGIASLMPLNRYIPGKKQS